MKNFELKAAIALIASSALVSGMAIAQDGNTVKAYVTDNAGKYVRDHEGKCVRTAAWSKESANRECNPELFPEPVATAAEPVYEAVTLSAEALFAFDSATLSAAGKAALQALGDDIRAKGASVVDIDIIGHTDSTGPEAYNQKLSERRAMSVRDYIVNERGVDASIIDVIGKGEIDPVADNSTAEGRAQNRRVDVNVGVKAPQ